MQQRWEGNGAGKTSAQGMPAPPGIRTLRRYALPAETLRNWTHLRKVQTRQHSGAWASRPLLRKAGKMPTLPATCTYRRYALWNSFDILLRPTGAGKTDSFPTSLAGLRLDGCWFRILPADPIRSRRGSATRKGRANTASSFAGRVARGTC